MKARAHVDTVVLTCPKCGEDVPSPTGALNWTVDELDAARDARGLELMCGCGRALSIPKTRMVRT